MAHPKQDERPKRHRWAPGNYGGLCHWCGAKFVGDKLASECADCAYAEPHPAEAGKPALGAQRLWEIWRKR